MTDEEFDQRTVEAVQIIRILAEPLDAIEWAGKVLPDDDVIDAAMEHYRVLNETEGVQRDDMALVFVQIAAEAVIALRRAISLMDYSLVSQAEDFLRDAD